jgi:hypothetical protein
MPYLCLINPEQRNPMSNETTVKQSYTPSVNLSITKRGGRIDKVTTWVTGVSGSTRTEKSAGAR